MFLTVFISWTLSEITGINKDVGELKGEESLAKQELESMKKELESMKKAANKYSKELFREICHHVLGGTIDEAVYDCYLADSPVPWEYDPIF